MLIHSVISENDIFADVKLSGSTTEFIPIKYGFVEVSTGKHRVVKRLISTCPKDYLLECYQPNFEIGYNHGHL